MQITSVDGRRCAAGTVIGARERRFALGTGDATGGRSRHGGIPFPSRFLSLATSPRAVPRFSAIRNPVCSHLPRIFFSPSLFSVNRNRWCVKRLFLANTDESPVQTIKKGITVHDVCTRPLLSLSLRALFYNSSIVIYHEYRMRILGIILEACRPPERKNLSLSLFLITIYTLIAKEKDYSCSLHPLISLSFSFYYSFLERRQRGCMLTTSSWVPGF